MNVGVKESQSSSAEKKVAEVINPKGSGRFVLVCEHASNYIPEQYKGLGLSAKVKQSHIAWDPGAFEVALGLSRVLDAPFVHSNISRLLYDCNRPPTAKSSIPERSEIYDIKGNTNLDKDEINERAEQFYFPFRNTLSECLGAHSQRVGSTILVTVHTFTPIYQGRKRRVDIGILHDSDSRMADGMLQSLSQSDLRIARNQPYGPRDGVTHTLKEHGNRRGIANVMIEIRNDLVANEEQQEEIVRLLAEAIMFSANRLR